MTTTQMIDVMQAYDNGEEIEYFDKATQYTTKWIYVSDPQWNWRWCDYRIKVKKPEIIEMFEVMQKGKPNWFLHSRLYQQEDIQPDWIKTGRSFKVPKD